MSRPSQAPETCSPHRLRTGSSGRRELSLALVLTVFTMLVEIVAGWWSGSLALLADAGHMFTDASALGLSLFAAWFAARPATPKKTYGYYRTEILAALANGVALGLIVLWIYARALARLRQPPPVDAGMVMVVAGVGLAANLVSGWLLRHRRADNLNLQGAWLNVMSDALGSLGVIISGACIQWFGWTAADPIASMVIGVLIAVNAWALIRQSLNILLEGTPGHVRVPELVAAMRAIPGVQQVHDVHLWTITTGMHAMSGHVIVEDLGRSEAVLDGLHGLLAQRFGITHTTLQLESPARVCDQH